VWKEVGAADSTGVSQVRARTMRTMRAAIRAGAGPLRRCPAAVMALARARGTVDSCAAGAATVGWAALMSGTPSGRSGPVAAWCGAGSCFQAPWGGDHHVRDRDDDDEEEEKMGRAWCREGEEM